MTSRGSWIVCLAFALAVIGSVAVLGDSLYPAKPEEAFRETLDALREGDYLRYAALMHPEMIQGFQRMLGALVSSDVAGPVREFLFGTSDLLELGRLDDLEVLARFLEITMARVPELHGALTQSATTVLGIVYEGKDLAHVVYRMEFEVRGFDASSPALVTMRRHEKSWRLALTSELDVFMKQIEAGVQP